MHFIKITVLAIQYTFESEIAWGLFFSEVIAYKLVVYEKCMYTYVK